jgi:hypothetical protein
MGCDGKTHARFSTLNLVVRELRMDDIVWSRFWRPMYDGEDGTEAQSFQNILASELTSVHPLFSFQPKILGRCRSNDDVVAILNDGRIAVIHLTWKGKPDQNPEKYPSWGCFNTVEAFNRAIECDEDDDEEL